MKKTLLYATGFYILWALHMLVVKLLPLILQRLDPDASSPGVALAVLAGGLVIFLIDVAIFYAVGKRGRWL